MMTQYPGQFFIDVWDCRAMVAQYRAVEDRPHSVTWSRAANWETLEDQATEAVNAQGGWITQSGHYECPADLAARAVFDPEPPRRADQSLDDPALDQFFRDLADQDADRASAEESGIPQYDDQGFLTGYKPPSDPAG